MVMANATPQPTISQGGAFGIDGGRNRQCSNQQSREADDRLALTVTVTDQALAGQVSAAHRSAVYVPLGANHGSGLVPKCGQLAIGDATISTGGGAALGRGDRTSRFSSKEMAQQQPDPLAK